MNALTEANAERIRRAIPPELRANRTPVVYAMAEFMNHVSVYGEQIELVFAAMCWAREHP